MNGLLNIPNLFQLLFPCSCLLRPSVCQIFRYETFPKGPIHLTLTSAHFATSLLKSFITTVSTFCDTKIWLCREISASVLVKLQGSPWETALENQAEGSLSPQYVLSAPLACHFAFTVILTFFKSLFKRSHIFFGHSMNL